MRRSKVSITRLAGSSVIILMIFWGFCQAQNPWELPNGPQCFERWIQTSTGLLNNYQGTSEFNSRKPWSFNQYGLLEGGTAAGPRSVSAPDAWAQYNSSKYAFMWIELYRADEQYPYWNNENWRGAGIPGMRYFVLQCLDASPTGVLPPGGMQTPMPGFAELTSFDPNALCPSDFSHPYSTLTIICYCSPNLMTGTVWGSGIYTSDSSLCNAALHTGAVPASGGMIIVKGLEGQSSYEGSTRHGVSSNSYGAYIWSFYFPNVTTTHTIPTAPTPNTAPALTSTFTSSNTEGWTVNYGDLRINDNYLTIESPSDGNTSYYIAPAGYHGSWLAFSRLHFDLYSAGGSYHTSLEYGAYGDIYLANGSMFAHRSITNPHDGTWRSYSIPLEDDGRWVLGGGATTLQDVLRNVTDFQIRAEYGAGIDTSGLDNVRLE